jgi:hypothetical protein
MDQSQYSRSDRDAVVTSVLLILLVVALLVILTGEPSWVLHSLQNNAPHEYVPLPAGPTL